MVSLDPAFDIAIHNFSEPRTKMIFSFPHSGLEPWVRTKLLQGFYPIVEHASRKIEWLGLSLSLQISKELFVTSKH